MAPLAWLSEFFNPLPQTYEQGSEKGGEKTQNDDYILYPNYNRVCLVFKVLEFRIWKTIWIVC